MSLGVVIVGLGNIGMGYDLALEPDTYVYSHARAFTDHEQFEVLAAVDPDPVRCQMFERAYGRPSYTRVGAALRDHRAEVVAIACPTHIHREMLTEVIAHATPRAVLCEKPLAPTLAEASSMVEACAARRIGLFVNYIRRSDPGVIAVKDRIIAGEIRTPVKGIAWYSKGFLHSGSHLFNLLEYWLGPVHAGNVIADGPLWNDVDPEPDAVVQFESGPVVFLSSREAAFSHHTIELLTANGRLRYDNGGELIEWRPARPDPLLSGYVTLATTEWIASGMNRYQWHVADQLAKALGGRPYHLCTGEEALATLASMTAVITPHADRH